MTKCPKCGSDGCYNSGFSIECANKECELFSQKQHDAWVASQPTEPPKAELADDDKPPPKKIRTGRTGRTSGSSVAHRLLEKWHEKLAELDAKKDEEPEADQLLVYNEDTKELEWTDQLATAQTDGIDHDVLSLLYGYLARNGIEATSAVDDLLRSHARYATLLKNEMEEMQRCLRLT